MCLPLFLLFIVVPIIELAILFNVAGIGGSILLILATGALGSYLINQQGMRTLRSMQERLDQGEMPADTMLDGFMLLPAAAFLITPGLITDVAGLLLLVPPVRASLRKWVWGWLMRQHEKGTFTVVMHGRSARGPGMGGQGLGEGFGGGQAPWGEGPRREINVTPKKDEQEDDPREG